MVRIAVAALESVFLIPHFASMEVSPANRADPNANRIHICNFPVSYTHLTGASWLCYYRALQDGLASVVVPIDKLSILAVSYTHLSCVLPT